MTTEVPTITDEERELLRWQDHEASGWVTKFFDLCAVSDKHNLVLLSKGFGRWVGAYLAWTQGNLAQRAEALKTAGQL